MLTLILGVDLSAAAIAADAYTIDSAHTVPGFEVKHFGITTQRGRFDQAWGQIELDIAAHRGSVFFGIDVRTVDIGSAAANRLLASDALLDAARYPVMTFQSQHLIFDGDGVVAAEGILTLAGTSRPLRIDVSGFACRTHPLLQRRMCGGDISATLRRSEYGMDKMLPDIGDLVRIDVPVEALADAATTNQAASSTEAPQASDNPPAHEQSVARPVTQHRPQFVESTTRSQSGQVVSQF